MGSSIGVGDRVLRSVFVALAVGLGWAIRGDFGHLIGAMYPGAALGLGFAYVSGQRRLFRWMPVVATLTGLGIGAGGYTSYGLLHGYAQSDTVLNYGYGFFALFMQGGVWGVFAGAAVGLLLERTEPRAIDWAGAVATVFLTGIVFQFLVTTVIGFHVNPPRSDASVGYVGGAMGLFAWLVMTKKRCAFKGALFGFLGFGLGMSLGRLLGNLANVAQEPFGFTINTWNVMEMSVGLIGGFIFTFGMLGKRAPDRMEEPPAPALAAVGAAYVLSLILILHRVTRIEAVKRLGEWTDSFTKYGYANPQNYAQGTLRALDLLCAAGVVLTVLWLYLHYRDQRRFAWYPVLALSLELLLFQNLAALYFFYPRVAGQINMHNVFWVLFALMGVYILVRELRGGHPDAADPDETADAVNWRAWAAGGVGAYLLIVFAAHFVNGPITMRSANTRWPLWTWSQGPFPGTQVTAPDAQGKKGP